LVVCRLLRCCESRCKRGVPVLGCVFACAVTGVRGCSLTIRKKYVDSQERIHGLVSWFALCEGNMGCDCIDQASCASQSRRFGTNARYPRNLAILLCAHQVSCRDERAIKGLRL